MTNDQERGLWGARMLPQAMRITETVQQTDRVRTFTLDGRLPAHPGQFVMVWLPGLDEKPFSLVADDPVILAVAAVGPFSGRLHELSVGDRLWLRGPFGHGFEIVGENLLLVAGGYGAAPLAFLSSRTTHARRKVAVLGAATGEDLFFQDRFAKSGCEVVLVTEDCTAGEGGLCTNAAERLLSEKAFDVVYGCGPEGMLDKIEELCQRAGIPGQFSKEAYMRCGMGVCGSCQRRGLLVCQDGPVFTVSPGA